MFAHEAEWNRVSSELFSAIGPGESEVYYYSELVQLFAALTVESALAAYGVIRFGTEQFQNYERVEHPDLVTKLVDVLDTEYAGRPVADDPLVCRRAAARRAAQRFDPSRPGRPTRARFSWHDGRQAD